jgi:hypothetical protein
MGMFLRSPCLLLPLFEWRLLLHVSASEFNVLSTMSHSERVGHGSFAVTDKEIKTYAFVIICHGKAAMG